MGWKGTIRSINASIKRAERESQRRQRQQDRNNKAYAKMVAQEMARFEVQQYEELLIRLVTLHHDHMESIDWAEIAAEIEPARPVNHCKRELNAKMKFESYSPGFFMRLFRLGNWMKKRLHAKIEIARQADARQFDDETTKFEIAHNEWAENHTFATRILNGELEAYAEAVKELNEFEDISDIGSEVKVSFTERTFANATINVHSADVVPAHSKSLMKSGKVSEKPIPKARFNEIYQDHICSAVLRIAAEILAILPIDKVTVTATDNLLNPSTGHLEEQAILLVTIPRRTLESLNLVKIDPSDSLKNFVHEMDFHKSEGFRPLKPTKLVS